MTLESPSVTVPKSPQTVFETLMNVKNFESLMPDNISKFQILSEDTFLFALKGMPEIVLKRKSATPHSQIVLGAAGGKMAFSLIAHITSTTPSSSNVKLEFSGDFNPMMTMMIKKPIGKFIETLSANIPSIVQ